jgi:NAD(P)-dependent dehydrogenase (short-subunit alcohol dehydrogenase family)
MGKRFENKVAVVTGGGQGIGEGYAKALAREGASIVVAEIAAEQGERVVREIGAESGKAIFVSTDVSSEESTRAMGQAAIEEFGGVDYLINNAAIYGNMELHSLLTVPMDYYNRFMSVNQTGCLLATRGVHASMIELDGRRLLRDRQARHARHHAQPGARAGSQEHPRERGRPRPHRHRGHAQGGSGLHPQPDPGQHAAVADG